MSTFTCLHIFENAKTNREKALSYMRYHGAVSPLRAMSEWQDARLAARIQELREEGWDVRAERCTAVNGKRYFQYELSTRQMENPDVPRFMVEGQPTLLRIAT